MRLRSSARRVGAVSSDRGTTHDVIFEGDITLAQPAKGYRFTSDAVLLATAAAERAPERFVDAGAGCGVVGIALCHLVPGATGIALERDPELAAFARVNAAAYGGRIRVREGDLRQVTGEIEERFELVVMNPPYFPPGVGRLSPDAQRAAARHQLYGEIKELVSSLSSIVRPDGHLMFIYSAPYADALLSALTEVGFREVALRRVHSRASADARVVVVDACRSKVERRSIRPPWILYEEDGQPSSLLLRIVQSRQKGA